MIDPFKLKHHMWDVVGALYEVHKELGAGLNEAIYQEGLKLQLEELNIDFEKEVVFHPTYHGKEMETSYRLDFLCKKDIIIELKAVEKLGADNRAQLFNYMHLFKPAVGILVNFASKHAEIETYLYDNENNEILTREGNLLSRTRK